MSYPLKRVPAFLALLAALAGACVPETEPPRSPEDPLANTLWLLTELGGDSVALPPSLRLITLRFRPEGHVTGFTGCNILTARYLATDGRLDFRDPISTTRRMCPDTPTRVQERVLLDALREVGRYERTGSGLNLYAEERLLGRLEAITVAQ